MEGQLTRSPKEARLVKALVLAGGTGTRLRPFTHSTPKQLIPIANKPVLEYVIEDIRRLDVTDVCVVVGDRAEAIEEALGDGSRFGVRLTYQHQARPLGLADAVRVARPVLGDDDFLMYLGDIMLLDGAADIGAEFARHRPAAGVVVQKVADPRAYGVVELDADGAVCRLVEKPAEPRSNLAAVGVYFFTAAIHQAIASIVPSARGELEISDAIQWLITRGDEVQAREYHGVWHDVGRVADLLTCNRRVLADLEPSIGGTVDSATEVSGMVVVAPGARVTRSTLEGPIIVGAGAVIEDSWVGPATSIGRDCTVRGSTVTNSVVLDGARITDVGGLHGSVVGRCATVEPVAPHESGCRLHVGDHARIQITAA
jgi:glucose-1-phosphate thymidylyltransferase